MAKTRKCQRCKADISAERCEAVPRTRLCTACAHEVEVKYGGEIRPVIREKKMGKKGGLKHTGVDYEVELRRNPDLPQRFDDNDD